MQAGSPFAGLEVGQPRVRALQFSWPDEWLKVAALLHGGASKG